MKWLKRGALILLGVLLLAAATAWWLLGSNAGTRFALARAHSLTNGALTVEHANGHLLGPLDLTGIRYDDGRGTRVTIGKAHLHLHAWPLWSRQLWARELRVDDIAINLPENSPATDTAATFSLEPPVELRLDRAHVGTLKVSRGTHVIFDSSSLDLRGSWTRAGLALQQFDLHAPAGYVTLQGTLALGQGYRGHSRASFVWDVDGTRYAGALVAGSDGQRAQVAFNLSRPAAMQLQVDTALTGDWAWTAKLDAPRFDPAPLFGPSSITALAVAVQGHGDRHSGTLNGRVDLNDYQLLLQPLRARFNDDFSVLTVQQLELGSPQIKGQVHASGSMQLDASPVQAELSLRWNDLLLPASLSGQDLASHGQLKASGSVANYHAEGEAAIGPPAKLTRLAVKLDGTPRLLTLRALELRQAHGGMQARGTLTLQPALAWQVRASASKFDPGQLFAGWSGALDFDVASTGTLPANGPDATLDIHRLSGKLRARSVSGNGSLHLSPDMVLDGQLELASGRSQVHVAARPGASNQIDVTLTTPALGDWLPNAGGQMDGRFTIGGRWPKLSINGQLRGRSLRWQQQRVETLHLIAGLPDTTRIAGKLDLQATGVHAQGLTFQRLHALAEGSEHDHRLTVDARGTQLSGELVLHGALQGTSRWNGTLVTLTLEPQGLPTWQLQSPARLTYNAGAMSLSELCLSAGDPLVCAAAKLDKAGNLDATWRLHALPLALVLNATGQADLPVRADGTLEGSGKLQRNAAGTLTGDAIISSPAGSITYTDRADAPLLRYDQLRLDADITPARQRYEVHSGLDDSGRLDGQITISGAQQALAGQLDARVHNLAFVELLSNDLANVKGSVNADFRFVGTLQQPAITGQAKVSDFAAEAPAAGLKLTHGVLAVSTTDARQFRVDGSVQSGVGQLAIDGRIGLGAGAQTAVTLKGSQFTAIDIPAAKVVVAPDLIVRHGADGMDISGALSIDSAELNADKLPGAGTTKASPDVVVVDQQQQEQAARKVPIRAQVKVDLGSRTHIVGMGLDGNVSGVLMINERPGRATTGQGQLAVDGTYRAYGQNLHIQRGQLLFAGTPIDNPGLNIRAVRKLNPNATIDEGQEVGLLIAGTAQRPILTVFSNPVMEQSDALSYLVTGKPLSQVKGGEGDMVSAAAQALGSAAGDLLARSVGTRIGVDDIGVSSNAALGGSSAFTVGKFLSPRLYVSYGVGLFEPGEVITLRYRLSKRWNFEAQQATEFSRASFNYRIEK